MDEKDKKIQALEAEIATKKAEVESLQTKVTEKDVLIEQKNQDIIGTRNKYKKLAEMSEDERNALSEREKELIQRAEDIEAREAKIAKDMEDNLTRDRTARREAAIRKLVGTDPELKKKLEDNFALLKDSDKATTEDEIGTLITNAYNMLGEAKPNPIASAVNNLSGSAPGDAGASFADSEAGQRLASALNLESSRTTSDGKPVVQDGPQWGVLPQ